MSDDRSDADQGPSRRDFLKGVGVAAGAGVALPALLTRAEASDTPGASGAPPQLVTLGRDARKITLRINGRDRQATVEPRTTLLTVLREQLELTGAKPGCDRGACGACTVLVDGTARASCMTLAIDVADHAVTTVEGLADDPAWASLIDAFTGHDAAQCGFCTPGFVVRSAALLEAAPETLDRAAIQRELSGNLCRCGAYPRIFDAVAHAARIRSER